MNERSHKNSFSLLTYIALGQAERYLALLSLCSHRCAPPQGDMDRSDSASAVFQVHAHLHYRVCAASEETLQLNKGRFCISA